MSVKFDTTDFDKKSADLIKRIAAQRIRANKELGDEVLRLSAVEVPIDTGQLLMSGHVEQLQDGSAIVGYNKVYAARLHENPQYHFRNNRKGKYLEQPIRMNIMVLREHFKRMLESII